MKRFLSSSFRNRLFVGFLCGSLIPLLVCSALLLQIFRLQMTQDAKDEAQEELADAAQQLDETVELFVHAARAVEADGIIADALESGLADDPVVYNRFLELTGSIRGSACIELYDASGRQLYSTRSLAHSEPLPTHWGLLYAACRPCSGRGTTSRAPTAPASQAPCRSRGRAEETRATCWCAFRSRIWTG